MQLFKEEYCCFAVKKIGNDKDSESELTNAMKFKIVGSGDKLVRFNLN